MMADKHHLTKSLGIYAPNGHIRIRNFILGEEQEITSRYIVGIDLGDGETCLSYIAADSSSKKRRPVFSFNGRETIPSAIADLGNRIIIGEAAMIRSDVRELQICFKSEPSKKNDRWILNEGKILLFLKKLFEEFSKEYPQVANDCEIFIGCPSSWKEESREKYEEHFQKYFDGEDFPRLCVVPESRAALIQALDLSKKGEDSDSEQHLRKLIHKRVLLIDIGSSTTDITVLNNLDPSEIEIGGDFGLNLVDQRLRATLYKLHPEGEKFKELIENNHENKQGRGNTVRLKSPNFLAGLIGFPL